MDKIPENTKIHGLFDSHAHYTDPAYAGCLSDVLKSVRLAGILGILLPATTVTDSEAACLLSEQHPCLYASIGVHPLYTKETPSDTDTTTAPEPLLSRTIDALRALARRYRVCAIGEIGLDYRFSKKDPVEVRRQKDLFDAQLSLCEELHLPALIHSIHAAADTVDLLRSHPNVTGVMHGFSYSPEIAGHCLKLGWGIGIGTSVLNPDARRIREVLRILPADSILLESDCPYQPKTKEPGQLPDSSVIRSILLKIASLRPEDPQDLASLCTENTRRILSLPKESMV